MFVSKTSVLRISVRGNLSIYVSFIMRNTVQPLDEVLKTSCLRIYPIPERMRNFLLLKDMMRKVKNIRFENLRINGKLIDDHMLDKPQWYKTSDMARIYVGPHVENIVFTSDSFE